MRATLPAPATNGAPCSKLVPLEDFQPVMPVSWPLIFAAMFSLIWIIHRASVQSITLDEANTFRYWVAPDSPTHWNPHSNNHVLNSSLMRVCIWLFGLSHISVRAPALLGGFLYILAIYRFSTLVAAGVAMKLALFVCLVYNPFIMDYLVAARGYGLALGFYGLAMYVLARMLVRPGANNPCERQILNHAVAISTCVALSFCANFTFGFAGTFLLLLAGSCATVWGRRETGMAGWARLTFALTFPAVLIILVFAGSALTQFPRDQLFWGTDSLRNTWRDIREASFIELNPYLVNPLLASILHAFERQLMRTIGITGLVYLFLIFGGRQRREAHSRSRLLLAGGLALVLGLTVLAHWLQFKLLNMPLPFERTSIFIVPLLTSVVGVIFSIVPIGPVQRSVRGAGVVLLVITGLYFTCELRDSYFREWRNCADVRAAFPVVVDLSRRAGIREVASDLNLTASFNFYRSLHKISDIDSFDDFEKMPAGKAIYVLDASVYADFIHAEGLEVFWRGTISDLVILVRPGTPGIAISEPQKTGL